MDLEMAFITMIIDDVLLIFPHRGSSNEHPQSLLLIQNKKKKPVYPCKPHFSLYNVGFPECSLQRLVNIMVCLTFLYALQDIQGHLQSISLNNKSNLS